MNNLRKLRKDKGLTQQELAQKMQTTKLTISNWENEKHTIKADKAQQLADFFGVSTGYLLGYDESSDLMQSIYEKYKNSPADPKAHIDFLGHDFLAYELGEKVRDRIVENLREFYNYHSCGSLAEEEKKAFGEEGAEQLREYERSLIDKDIDRFLGSLVRMNSDIKLIIADLLSLPRDKRKAISEVIKLMADNPRQKD